MTRLDTFFCEGCGAGIFYVLKLNGQYFLLCFNCGLISNMEEKENQNIR